MLPTTVFGSGLKPNDSRQSSTRSLLTPSWRWGGPGGVVYQKAYLEFFVPADKWEQIRRVIDSDARYSSITYHATNHDGSREDRGR